MRFEITGSVDPLLSVTLEKGEKVEVLGYDELNSDGSVDVYKVKYNDQEGYVYSKYLVNNHEDSATWFKSAMTQIDKHINGKYQFLQKMQTLSEKYEMDIPFGASEKVDDFAKTFIERYSLEELSHVAKTNFANYEKIKGSK